MKNELISEQMERGLFGLSLLILFVGLAWAGWHEYQKIEAYRRWASAFDHAKYDIYSVVGQKDNLVTWGKPTSTEPLDIQRFSLEDVAQIYLLIDDHLANLDDPPSKGTPVLVFELAPGTTPIKIPFTEIPMAIQWVQHLQKVKAGLSSVDPQ
jgi:hypothetical protein